jgi:hypothetical protein
MVRFDRSPSIRRYHPDDKVYDDGRTDAEDGDQAPRERAPLTREMKRRLWFQNYEKGRGRGKGQGKSREKGRGEGAAPGKRG